MRPLPHEPHERLNQRHDEHRARPHTKRQPRVRFSAKGCAALGARQCSGPTCICSPHTVLCRVLWGSVYGTIYGTVHGLYSALQIGRSTADRNAKQAAALRRGCAQSVRAHAVKIHSATVQCGSAAALWRWNPSEGCTRSSSDGLAGSSDVSTVCVTRPFHASRRVRLSQAFTRKHSCCRTRAHTATHAMRCDARMHTTERRGT